MKTETGTAPSHWASYLINGDSSGLESADIRAADAFQNWLGGAPADCEEAGFMHYHDATKFGVLAADCAVYTVLIH